MAWHWAEVVSWLSFLPVGLTFLTNLVIVLSIICNMLYDKRYALLDDFISRVMSRMR